MELICKLYSLILRKETNLKVIYNIRYLFINFIKLLLKIEVFNSKSEQNVMALKKLSMNFIFLFKYQP